MKHILHKFHSIRPVSWLTIACMVIMTLTGSLTMSGCSKLKKGGNTDQENTEQTIARKLPENQEDNEEDQEETNNMPGKSDTEEDNQNQSTDRFDEDQEENIQDASLFSSSSGDMSDEAVQYALEQSIYERLIDDLPDDMMVSDIDTVYISKEYLEELDANSKSNIFFGYTLAELDKEFAGTRYVFTPDASGQTTVQAFESTEAIDEVWLDCMKSVAIGTGVIVVAAGITYLGAAGACTMGQAILAMSSKVMEDWIANGAPAAIASGIMMGEETQDYKEALKAAAVTGSQAFQWSALYHGVKSAIADGPGAVRNVGSELRGKSEALGAFCTHKGINGEKSVSLSQVCKWQKETRYPISVLRNLQTDEQVALFHDNGYKPEKIGGKFTMLKNLEQYMTGDLGCENLERLRNGKSIVDENGNPFELHLLAQDNEVYAYMTQDDHRKAGNSGILHLETESKADHGKSFTQYKSLLRQELLSRFVNTISCLAN